MAVDWDQSFVCGNFLGFFSASLLLFRLEYFILLILGCSILCFVLSASSFLFALGQKLLKSYMPFSIGVLDLSFVLFILFYHHFSGVLDITRAIVIQFIFLNQRSVVVYLKLA